MAKIPVIQMRPEEPLGRRTRHREQVGLPAIVRTMRGSSDGILRNISPTGAMIELSRPPAVGNEVIVRCGAVDAMGMVVWRDRERCGIRFAALVESREIARLSQLGQQARRASLTPELIDAARDWSHGKFR